MHVYDVNMSADVSLVAATATTVWQLITPATRWAKIKEIHGGFRSTNSTEQPVILELVKQTTAGTTGGSLTPRPKNSLMPASLCTVNITFSGEPTLDYIRWTHILPPQGGNMIFQLPLGDEFELQVSERLGLRITCPQNQVFRGGFRFEE